jgi:hypothetical protein
MRNGFGDVRGAKKAEREYYKREEKRRKQREKAAKSVPPESSRTMISDSDLRGTK